MKSFTSYFNQDATERSPTHGIGLRRLNLKENNESVFNLTMTEKEKPGNIKRHRAALCACSLRDVG